VKRTVDLICRRLSPADCLRVPGTASIGAWLKYSLVAVLIAIVRSVGGLRQIDRWMMKWNRSFVESTKQLLEKIKLAVGAVDEELRANLMERIGFVVNGVNPAGKAGSGQG